MGRNPLADAPRGNETRQGRQTSTEVPRSPLPGEGTRAGRAPEAPRGEGTQQGRAPQTEAPRDGTQPRSPQTETPRGEGTQQGRSPQAESRDVPQQARSPQTTETRDGTQPGRSPQTTETRDGTQPGRSPQDGTQQPRSPQTEAPRDGTQPRSPQTEAPRDGTQPRSPQTEAPRDGTQPRSPQTEAPRGDGTQQPRSPQTEAPRDGTQSRAPVPEAPRGEGTQQSRDPVPEAQRGEGTQQRSPQPEAGAQQARTLLSDAPQQPRAPVPEVPQGPGNRPPHLDGAQPPPPPRAEVPLADGARPRTAEVPGGEAGPEELGLPLDAQGEQGPQLSARGESRVSRRQLADGPRDGGAPPRPGTEAPKTSGNEAEASHVIASESQLPESEPRSEAKSRKPGEALLMSSLRVLNRFVRLPGLGAPRRPEESGPSKEAVFRPRPGADDAFRSRPLPLPGRPAIAGDERAPLKSVGELVPPGLEAMAGQEDLAHRFASDAALLAMQLKPANLPGSERAQRLWAFYAAYAEAAAALPRQEEAREAFREGLEGQGFAELHDAHTGENGVARGLWVLDARHPTEARERAATVRLEPPPEVLHSEAAARQDPSLAAMQGPRGTAIPVAMEQRSPWEQAAELPRRLRRGMGRLSPQMFWNVLHTFRSPEEEGAVAEGHWDRVVFAAILALTGIVLVVVALVSL